MASDVLILAVGRWPGILTHFGVDERCVSGKHAPCPICGGEDRFRLIDKDGGARWICNQCGSGDGMDLLMAVLGCDFNAAAEKLKPIVGGIEYVQPSRGPDKAERMRRVKNNVEMWNEAGDSGLEMLHEYLGSRKIHPNTYTGVDLRVHLSLPYYDDDGKRGKDMPCMLARISTAEGKLAALHRTYLHKTPDGKFVTKKKISSTSREWRGGAIRLFRTDKSRHLIVGEGIETVMSVRAMFAKKLDGKLIPCWAGVSANNLEKMAIPEHITNILIAADNDYTFTGQKAAYALANRLVVHNKRKATVDVPPITGHDFNDELMEMELFDGP